MLTDNDIYIDSEDDEVFFGCISEKEKTIRAKLVNQTDKHYSDCLSNDEVDSVISSVESNNNLNMSVEQEHNYSTVMKHKIDKTILATPKSLVKADKDGGFLKVLSEIALVKAEAEGEVKKGDEDKENKMIPEIRIIEATPDKGPAYISPPKSTNTSVRRFRIIYNEESNFENSQNMINKSLDHEAKEFVNDVVNQSVNLIDLNNSFKASEAKISGNGSQVAAKAEPEVVTIEDNTKEKKENLNKENGESEENLTFFSANNDNSVTDDKELNKNDESTSHSTEPFKKIPDPPPLPPNVQTSQPPLRFSKEARMIVDMLKKSTVDDTIPEIDVESVESSFLSAEQMPCFEETVLQEETTGTPKPTSNKNLIEKKIQVHPYTVEKEKHKITPLLSNRKMEKLKYFTDNKIYNEMGNEIKKCVKKLPMEEKRILNEKSKGTKTAKDFLAASTSKIPVFNLKPIELPIRNRLAHSASTKTTPAKTPCGTLYKNPKYKNIKSPINAYINNKPTSLVLNVKPDLKKESITKVWNSQSASAKKAQEKNPVPQKPKTAPALPFVEYRSATPYILEKQSESRLPRLAPTVEKLIGKHSPRILKHEGRFHVKTPNKPTSTEDTTILAETNEVSLIVSKTALKSDEIK